MNRRIMKKLSKRAVPVLRKLGDTRDVIERSMPDDGYIEQLIERKHWERMTVQHDHPPACANDIKTPTKKNGRWVILSQSYVGVLPCTPLMSWMSGYEEPEWETSTAYDALCDYVHFHLMDYSQVDDDGVPIMIQRHDLSTPRKVFNAAEKLVAEKGAQRLAA